MAEIACPRTVLLSHLIAVAAGLISRWILLLLLTGEAGMDPLATTWSQVACVSAAMALVTVAMIALRWAHPPAAATATLAAMGFFQNFLQLLGLLLALVFLLLEALLLNRILGGVPYPLWRSDPHAAARYGSLAGISEASASSWQRVSRRLQKRRPDRVGGQDASSWGGSGSARAASGGTGTRNRD
jgi:hypothetical protein